MTGGERMSGTQNTTVRGGKSAARWVVWLCWAAVALEGFDLVVLGAVVPSLLDY
jgi:MFS transporter, AAHS family, benzoate transport protein